MEHLTITEAPNELGRGLSHEEQALLAEAAEGSRTIDITPMGCKTPEGAVRVAETMKAWEETHAQVANAATSLLREYGDLMSRQLSKVEAYDGIDQLDELRELIRDRDQKQAAFFRAVAGAPAK